VALSVVAPADTEIEIDTVMPGRAAHSVRITYRSIGAGNGVSRPAISHSASARFVECRFGGSRFSSTRLVLRGLETERGAFRESEMYLLNRFWMESVEADIQPLPPAPGAARGAFELSAGLALALQYALAALPQIAMLMLLAPAYALIYGLMGRINLAFGELVIVGGQGAVLGLILGGLMFDGAVLGMLLTSAALALAVALAHGDLLARHVLAPLSARRGQVVLVATIGAGIGLSEYVRLAQSSGGGSGAVAPMLNTPIILAQAGSFAVSVTEGAVLASALALGSSAALLIVMRRTRFGLTWRAVADEPFAAALLGINGRAVLVRTMGIASVLAGFAGFIMTMHYGSIGVSNGLALGLKALIAAILGGIGSVGGAIAGALLVGALEAVWSAFLPLEHRDSALYALLVVLLVFRPGGLFGLSDGSPRSL
jgi:branched-chain amino acid transport system permease protein